MNQAAYGLFSFLKDLKIATLIIISLRVDFRVCFSLRNRGEQKMI